MKKDCGPRTRGRRTRTVGPWPGQVGGTSIFRVVRAGGLQAGHPVGKLQVAAVPRGRSFHPTKRVAFWWGSGGACAWTEPFRQRAGPWRGSTSGADGQGGVKSVPVTGAGRARWRSEGRNGGNGYTAIDAINAASRSERDRDSRLGAGREEKAEAVVGDIRPQAGMMAGLTRCRRARDILTGWSPDGWRARLVRRSEHIRKRRMPRFRRRRRSAVRDGQREATPRRDRS